MGIGHASNKQFSFAFRKQRFSYGGELRKKRCGRGQRPLSTKQSLHAVFKLNKIKLQHRSLRSAVGFRLTVQVIRQYSKRFKVKIEHLSIQNDHIHILIRTTRRSHFHHFFRVVAGQIAQRFEKEGLFASTVTDTPDRVSRTRTSLWIHRPFSRVVIGARAFKIARDYIQLNEKEITGQIPYRKTRLRGLSSADWEILWS